VQAQHFGKLGAVGQRSALVDDQRLAQMAKADHALAVDHAQDQLQLQRRWILLIETTRLGHRAGAKQPVAGHHTRHAEQIVEVKNPGAGPGL
jgi:hypothetical protein